MFSVSIFLVLLLTCRLASRVWCWEVSAVLRRLWNYKPAAQLHFTSLAVDITLLLMQPRLGVAHAAVHGVAESDTTERLN